MIQKQIIVRTCLQPVKALLEVSGPATDPEAPCLPSVGQGTAAVVVVVAAAAAAAETQTVVADGEGTSAAGSSAAV